MDASLDELLEFFKRDNAVEHLQMRYFDKKAFKVELKNSVSFFGMIGVLNDWKMIMCFLFF